MNFITQSSLLIAGLLMGGCAMFSPPGSELAEAAHRGDIQAIHQLIAAGADVNAIGADGRTALHWAVRGGHPVGPHRCTGETAERLQIVAQLLDAGADPDIADTALMIPGRVAGWTSLHMAIRHEQFQTATLLLERGANPNILSQQGGSALAMAANERAPKALLELILAHGFDAQVARRPDRR